MTDQQFRVIVDRIDGISGEYRQLVDFLGRKFGAIDRRFDLVDQRFEALEGRVGRVEVSGEGHRRQLQIVAEGVAMNGQRLDRHERRLESLETSVNRLLPLEGAVMRLVEQVEILNLRVDAHS